MIFVDACVLESAIGPAGEARDDAQAYFLRAAELGIPLVTSAAAVLTAKKALQALPAIPVDALLELVRGRLVEVWPLEVEDVYHAHRLRREFPPLAEDALVTLAACRRRGVGGIQSRDGMLRYAAGLKSPGMRLTGVDRARLFQREWEERKRREREREEQPSWP